MKNAVITWAKKQGYKFKFFGPSEGQAIGILIYTDYLGPYPPREVYAEHSRISAYCKRTGRKYKPGTMHVGARVYF